MAVRFDNSADHLVRSSGVLSHNAAYTVAFWLYITTDLNAYSTVYFASPNSLANYDYLGTGGDGTTLLIAVDSSTGSGYTENTGGTSLSTGTWYHIALVRASATSLQAYLNGVANGTALTNNVGSRTATTRMEFGAATSGNNDPFNGRVAFIKIWDAALSVAEIQNEIYRAWPQRTANLWAWYPTRPGSPERAFDSSGNGRPWTEAGTLTDEDDPPISWAAPPAFAPFVTAGTTYNLTVALTSTSTTPDTAAQSVDRALTMAPASTSSTPDTPVAAVDRPLVSALTSASSTPDTTTLTVAGDIALTMALTSTSSTPDAAIVVDRALTVAMSSATTTPDTAAIAVARALVVGLTSVSSTPDTPALLSLIAMVMGRTSASVTNNAPWLVHEAAGLRFFGTASGNIDRVRIPLDTGGVSTAADVGAGDFTIEVWILCNYADNTTSGISDVRFSNMVLDRDIYGHQRGWCLGVTRVSGTLRVCFGVAGASLDWVTITGSASVGDGVWHHIAIDRRQSTGVITLYVDGTADGNSTYTTGDLSYPDGHDPGEGQNNPYLVLGAEKHDLSGAGYAGRMDELRISDTRRYTGNFTRPSAQFTPDANTRALYHFDQGTGTVLGDSATISTSPASPVSGELLVGGANNGPQWVTPGVFSVALVFGRTSASTTSDTAAIAIARALSVAPTSTSATPDTSAIAVARALSVTLNSSTTTTDTAILAIAREMAIALSSTSSTPDTATLLILLAMVMGANSASSTPDTAAIAIARDLTVALTSASSTPDTAMAVARALAVALTSLSTTNDGANLTVAGFVDLVMALTSTSSTPDAAMAVARGLSTGLTSASSSSDGAALAVERGLTIARTSLSSTPDASGLVLSIGLTINLTSASTSSDSPILAVARSLAMALSSSSSTNDAVMLLRLFAFAIALSSGSSTSDTSALAVARALAAALSSASSTNDAAVAAIARALAMAGSSLSITGDAVTLQTALIEGAITLQWTVRKPGMAFVARQPGITFEEE